MQKWLLIGIFLVFVMMPVANVPIGSAGAEELTPEQQKAVEETVQKYLRERACWRKTLPHHRLPHPA